jgi:hypothetical protein
MNSQLESMARALVFNPEQTRRMALANEAIRKLRKFDVFKVLHVDTNTSRPTVMVSVPLTDLAERLGASCIVSHSVGDGYLVTITAYEVDWCWRQAEPGTVQGKHTRAVEPRPAVPMSAPVEANAFLGGNVIPLIGGAHV